MLDTCKERFFNALSPQGVVCCNCLREWELGEQDFCPDCMAKRTYAPTLAQVEGLRARSAGILYEEWIQGAVYRFKYQGAIYLAKPLAGLMPKANRHPDLILPVPLWPEKERQRGYNQSLLLANAYQQRCYPDVPVEAALLTRVKDTGSQTRLVRTERWKNMKNAFAANTGVSGKCVLLIDDITTTGSTLRACARALLQAGAKSVEAVCVCAVL